MAVMIMVGLLLSISAGVRATLPLLAMNLLAYHHVIALPAKLAWLGTESTLVILGVAFVAETLVHFIPVVGTAVKTLSTPLAFAAGTLLMAIPLAEKNPLEEWALAGFMGGGLAVLTHAGVTGARALSSPVNLASGGIFGVLWNLGELVLSALLAMLGFACVFVGWRVGLVVVAGLLGGLIFLVVRAAGAGRRRSAVIGLNSL
jgi:hypothetical protein